RADEDIDEFIKDYRLYLTAANITTANAGGKQRALELFWSCLTDEASRWAEDKLKGKKWRLNHVRCGNALANMAAVVALNNANITAAMINAPDGTPPPGLPAGATGATVIPAHNIDKYAGWARISDREKRIQFLRGLSPENKLEMKRLGLNRPLNDDLIETLEEIETARNDLLLGEDIYNQPATKTKSKAPSHQNITTEDIDRIVNSRIQALQQSAPNLSPVSSSGQENITKADLQEAIAKSFQETLSRGTKTLDNSKKSANKRGEDLIIRRFLSELLRTKSNKQPEDDYNYDPVDDITDSMAGMTLNSATINAIKSAVKSAVKKKCTKCGRFGHTSRKCSVKKKKKSKKSKKGKVNLAIEPDSDSSSDIKKKVKKKSSTMSREIPLDETIRKVLLSELKLFFPERFSKDSSPVMSEQIVAPMERVSGQNDTSASSNDLFSDESSQEEEFLDGPMEIDFVKKKEPKTSVATVKCKIKRLKIPAMTLDSRAEPPIITKNIVVRVKAKIDESEKHDLSGVATVPIESIGVARNLPITLAPGLTIHEDFIVVDYHKSTLIFSNQLLKKYGCAVDWNTNELKIPFNGKDYIIPVTMHKVKNKLEVNYARTTPECDDLPAPDCISHDLQDLSEEDTLKKKVSYEDMAIRVKELEKKLFITLKFNAEINEFCESLLRG
ncbi:1943_t:CDS:2, partial [Rhizophagus irregularis]